MELVSVLLKAGSQFSEIDTFEDEKNVKRDEYIKELAKDYPDDTPLEDIIVTYKDAGIKILTDVLGVKRDNEVRVFETGRVRELKESTLRTRQLEEELTAEKATKDEAQRTLTIFMKG